MYNFKLAEFLKIFVNELIWIDKTKLIWVIMLYMKKIWVIVN